MKRKELIRRPRIEDMVEEYNKHLLPGEQKMTRSEMVGLVGHAIIKERSKVKKL